MYQANELLPVHAVAGPYRSRSHFEAQDYMEFGSDHRMTSGWLNRAPAQIPAGGRAAAGAIWRSPSARSLPLLLRGPATVGSWMPKTFGQPEPDLYARIAALNAHDPVTGPAIAEGLKERGFTTTALAGAETRRRTATPSPRCAPPPAGCSPPPTVRASRRWRSADGIPTRRSPVA